MDKKQLEDLRALTYTMEQVIKRDTTGSLTIADAVHKVRGLVEADLKASLWLQYLFDKGETE